MICGILQQAMNMITKRFRISQLSSSQTAGGDLKGAQILDTPGVL